MIVNIIYCPYKTEPDLSPVSQACFPGSLSWALYNCSPLTARFKVSKTWKLCWRTSSLCFSLVLLRKAACTCYSLVSEKEKKKQNKTKKTNHQPGNRNAGFSPIVLFINFLVPNFRHMEVPRKGVKSEVQPPAYTRATATQNLSHVCDLHHSSQQCRILNPRNEAKDWIWNLMVTSQIR